MDQIHFLKEELSQYLIKHGRHPSPRQIREWSVELKAPQFAVSKYVYACCIWPPTQREENGRERG